MSKTNSNLTQERLREVLRYCPATGLFSWIAGASHAGRGGEIAGCRHAKSGYTVIRVDGRLYLAHRLAFLYIYGRFPRLTDHKNGAKSDNRIENIRDADKSQNAQNTRKAWSHNKASGLLGVYWSAQRNAWGAKVNLNGKQHHAGFYETPEKAHEAYVLKKRQLHEFCTI